MNDQLYLKALRFLQFRPRSEKEISDYLIKKLSSTDVGNEIIDAIIQKLKAQRFLNDKEFAGMWVRSRKTLKPKGEWLIRMELKQKGISPEIIDEVFANENNVQKGDLELAVEILERKRKKFEKMEKHERFNKAGSMLSRRGFSLDIIKEAINSIDW